jgi:hypothetical protein
MAKPSELHLVVPGICGPLADIRSLSENHTVIEWIKFISRSKCSSSESSTYKVLTSLLNLTVDDDFPSASLSMLAHEAYDKKFSYMCADPVHLQVDMDHAILTSSHDLYLKPDESAAICDVLNKHFKQDGLSFISLEKNQWIVACKDEIALDTTPLSETIGRNVNFLLPRGKDSGFWKKILTEAQMLMHSHDVNVNRESSGKLSVNSLWFHGSGHLPDYDKQTSLSICSQDNVLKGLANHIGCDHAPVPHSFDHYKKNLLSGNSSVNILHLDELDHLVNYSDVTLWLDRLAELLNDWVYPIIRFSNKNKIKVTLYPCNKKQYQFSSVDSLKFWRQGKIEQYVSQY